MANDFFKYIAVAIVLFAAYNEFVFMRREPHFNELSMMDFKAHVVSELGQPQYTYQCGTKEKALSFLTYIDKMCQDKVATVEAYPLCLIPFRCPGWYYVSLDRNERLVGKYKMAN